MHKKNYIHIFQPKISDRELNPHLKAGLTVEQYPVSENKKREIKFGDAGSKWRMTKLKRVMEQAEDEERTVEEVGIERYGVSNIKLFSF